jgi:3-methyladenine DNA glycosylase AlkD
MNVIRLDDVVRGFRERGTADSVAGAKVYLKSELDFFGVPNAVFADAVKGEHRKNSEIDRAALIQLSLDCFESSYFEMRLFGVKYLERRARLFEPDDLRYLEKLVRMSEIWALVDSLAKPVDSSLVDRGLPGVGPILDQWSVDENFWVRRCSMLTLILGLKKSAANWDRFVGYADSMIDEREVFIRKAIGWMLREVSKNRSEPVSEYVRRYEPVISGVTFREAVKYLVEPERTELRTAYKNR